MSICLFSTCLLLYSPATSSLCYRSNQTSLCSPRSSVYCEISLEPGLSSQGVEGLWSSSWGPKWKILNKSQWADVLRCAVLAGRQ